MSSILLATVSLDSGTAPSLAAALSPIIILHMSCAAGKIRVSAIVCGLPSLPILLVTTYDASKHCLDTVLCTEMVACCWWRPSSFLLKYSAGLFLMPACFVSRCLFNLQGFILSFASTSAHTTHWGLRSAVTVNPNCRYASSYLRSFFAAGGASVWLVGPHKKFLHFCYVFNKV